MNLADSLFLLTRLATLALCLAAIRQCIKGARDDRRHPARRLRLVLAAAMMTSIGGLAIWSAFHEVSERAELPIAVLDWAWAICDLSAPAFFLLALRAFRERDELERQLAQAAEHDPLTGLPNRAGLAATALPALAQCFARGEPASLALLDIDRFKSVNDNWGHPAGDAVLRHAAAVMEKSRRQQDIVARIGGEEFLVILIGVHTAEARPIVERIREAIRQDVPHPGGDGYAVTVSAGIARIHAPHNEAVANAGRAADAALYEAKAQGRDRAILAPDDFVAPLDTPVAAPR
ncbi:GGDEF domain-containing protein [Roseococcus sp. YIM B11640]|uniref:GGDEF domain-containing protein n=1 Tax=Roseococcus sp. YIM B11640 TaxID=3133973 RepID=UPI003C7E5FF9